MIVKLLERWKRKRLQQWIKNTEADTVNVVRMGCRWTLDAKSCITEDIVCYGEFEPVTTKRVMEILQPGMTVLDVGANIGYFTVLMAKAVGIKGRVIAFEPTKRYRVICHKNIIQNGFAGNVVLRSEALSDQTAKLPISVGNASATLHWSDTRSTPRETEEIQACRLDDLIEDLSLNSLDFVKIDIDGHEPAFLRGAANTLQRYQPIIVVEFAQHCLHTAGTTALQLRQQLYDLGYVILSEKTMCEFDSELSFLFECGNYAFSANVFAIPANVRKEKPKCESDQ